VVAGNVWGSCDVCREEVPDMRCSSCRRWLHALCCSPAALTPAEFPHDMQQWTCPACSAANTVRGSSSSKQTFPYSITSTVGRHTVHLQKPLDAPLHALQPGSVPWPYCCCIVPWPAGCIFYCLLLLLLLLLFLNCPAAGCVTA
jgi:hypothetical protein